MSAQKTRRAQPDCVRYFLPHLRDGASVAIEQLVSTLVRGEKTKTVQCREIVENSVKDGLLVSVRNEKQKNNAADNVSPRRRIVEKVRFPSKDELKPMQVDAYCFECHLPGVLEKCRNCQRGFHSVCYREDPERPLYKVPSAKFQKNRPPAFSSDSNEGSDDEEDNSNENELLTTSSLRQANSSAVQQHNLTDEMALEVSSSSPQHVDNYDNIYEHKPIVDYIVDMDEEMKSQTEVMYVGEVRAPSRKRPATTASTISYKSELAMNDDQESEEDAKDLCTCCRLLATAALRNPANMQPDELCHLLNYTFTRNRSWMATDVPSYLQTKKVNTEELENICNILFIPPVQRLNTIADKLYDKKYNFLMQLLVDLLDLQHSIGVFFGSNSTEMDSTKWLIRDIQHDIAEIRRCPDCYRYSTERLSDLWFALPCVQRHELVYAKQSGFSFWPAKVIRVLPNNKYDVRFFGTDHSRALIEARNIRSIDTNVKLLKLRNTNALKKAIEELHYHQQLSNMYAASDFSFHANPLEIAKIIQSFMGGNILNVMRGHRRRNSIIDLMPTTIGQVEVNKTPNNKISAAKKRKLNERRNTTTQISSPHFAVIDEDVGAINRNIESADMSDLTSTTPPQRRARLSVATTVNNTERRRQTRSATKSDENDIPQEFLDIVKEYHNAQIIIEEFQKKDKKQRKQIQSLKEKVKILEQQKNLVKRKPWCYWCLEEATYLCCFRATYCSTVCQKRHWNDSHYKECKHESNIQRRTLEKN